MKREQKVKGLFSNEVKQSGFNTAKPYHDLIVKMFSIFHKSNEGSFDKTIELLTEYLTALEDSDLRMRNNDSYVKFKLELKKADRLPLFPKYRVLDVTTHYKDFQYLRLILKRLGYLLLDLNDQAIVVPNLKGFKTLLHLERVYIEQTIQSIDLVKKEKGLEQDELIDYFSSFNTLVSYFSAMVREGAFSGTTIKILKEIEGRNREVNSLVQEKFNIKAIDGQTEAAYDYTVVIPKTVQYV